MNKIIKTITTTAFTLIVTVPSYAQDGKAYGKEFKQANAIAATALSDHMGKKDKVEDVVVSGEISQVCQAEGCWMKMKAATGEDIFVKFKDHAFVIPKDLSGHKALVHGTAIRKTVSVADQKHFAEDAGKSAEEIAKIREPKTELRIEATGVVID